jgi:hypothetical protein
VSESSEKGKILEDLVAKTLRKKLGVQVQRDKRSGAGSHQKMDINDWWQSTPLDIEVKNHAAVNIKQWMRQAKAGASLGRIPTVVFSADGDVLATLPFDDLVDLLLMCQQSDAEVKRLREPIVKTAEGVPVDIRNIKPSELKGTSRECRGGNLVSPGEKKCLVKSCTYCHPKKTKGEKKV